MSTQEILLEEINHRPEPMLREQEQWADVLPTCEAGQEILDILDSK